MHVVCKETSTTTKLWAVFDASAHSSTGVFLNDVVDWAHSAFLSAGCIATISYASCSYHSGCLSHVSCSVARPFGQTLALLCVASHSFASIA